MQYSECTKHNQIIAIRDICPTCEIDRLTKENTESRQSEALHIQQCIEYGGTIEALKADITQRKFMANVKTGFTLEGVIDRAEKAEAERDRLLKVGNEILMSLALTVVSMVKGYLVEDEKLAMKAIKVSTPESELYKFNKALNEK